MLDAQRAARRGILKTAVLSAAMILAGAAAPWASASANKAAELLSLHETLAERLAASPLGMPIVIDSVESAGQLSGTVYAISNHSFNTLATSFARPRVWCEVMLLPFNTRTCQLDGEDATPTLELTITRKNQDETSQGHQLRLDWRKAASAADYLEVRLTSEAGPLGTEGYVIVLRAVPLGQGRTFTQFTFSFRYGTAARMATQAYLATVGRNKVGFSTVRQEGGERLVGGMRGIVERNAMRYYLALEAWLNTARLPPAQRLDARLREWFDATERYPRQLHEMDKSDYLAIKRRDYRTSLPPPSGG
jgi:hypothetical protein